MQHAALAWTDAHCLLAKVAWGSPSRSFNSTKGPIPIDKRPAWGGYIVHEKTKPRSDRSPAGDGSSASIRQHTHLLGSKCAPSLISQLSATLTPDDGVDK